MSTVREIGGNVGAFGVIGWYDSQSTRRSLTDLGVNERNQPQGAALVTKHDTCREGIKRRLAFKGYQTTLEFFDFARKRGHDSNPKLIFVTGIDLTRDIAMTAWSHNSLRLECKSPAAVSTVTSTSASLWET